MRKILGVLAIVVLGLSTSFGATVLDFSTGLAGTGGTLTQSGSTFIGTAIPLNTLTVTIGTTTTVYDLSGTATSSNQDADLNAALNFNTSTGTFTITGGVPTLAVPNGTLLLNGTISGINTIGCSGASICDIIFNPASDTKSPLLLAALGLSGVQFAFTGSNLNFAATAANTYTATSTDILNDAVPEPASLFLLGSGLLGLGGITRRKLIKR